MKKITYRVEELGTVVGGGTPSTQITDYWDGDIPWISPADLTGYTNVYISRGAKNITEDGLKKSSTKVLPEGTVLLSSRAPIGYLAIAQNDICTNQGFKSIICKENVVNNKYLYYYLKLNVEHLKAFASGATFPELSGNRLKRIKLNIAEDVDIQKQIAGILSTYDELIENNNKRIAILEQMTENLYKEWFVRFRFPGHETAKFENGLPKGWEYKRFSDFATFDRGISYSSEEIDCEDGVILINLKNIEAFGGFRRDGFKRYNGKYKNSQIVKSYDLIMGITDMTQDRRTVGAVAIIPEISNTCVISADLLKINSQVDNIFLYCMCRYGYYSKFFSQFANGANVLHLRPNILFNKKMLIPDYWLIDRFVEKIKPIMIQVNKLLLSNDNLIKQRDLLLPRLMSGKLEV